MREKNISRISQPNPKGVFIFNLNSHCYEKPVVLHVKSGYTPLNPFISKYSNQKIHFLSVSSIYSKVKTETTLS